VQNGPSVLYRLIFDGQSWVSTPTDGWATGKPLRYPDGTGDPDAEGVTRVPGEPDVVYVSTERNNSANTVSRLSVLRFVTSGSDTPLVATHEWNLTSDLPPTGPNLGLEGIAFVPDSDLVAAAFFDESRAALYDPGQYPDHGTGLFLVSVESTGVIYAFALDRSGGTFHRVATIVSGQPELMDLAWDSETGELWAQCDNTCGNTVSILRLTGGHFALAGLIARPSTLPNSNNEGISFAPLSECSMGMRSFFWSDDDNINGHALRRDTIPCTAIFP